MSILDYLHARGNPERSAYARARPRLGRGVAPLSDALNAGESDLMVAPGACDRAPAEGGPTTNTQAGPTIVLGRNGAERSDRHPLRGRSDRAPFHTALEDRGWGEIRTGDDTTGTLIARTAESRQRARIWDFAALGAGDGDAVRRRGSAVRT